MNNTKQKSKNGLSTAGFICALCGFITCGITSIVGLILSILGLSESKKRGEKDGLAIAGIIISAIPLAMFVLLGLSGAVSPNTESTNNETVTNETTNETTNDTPKSEKPAKENTNVKTYTKVDIDVLEDELDNNAAAAKEKYKGKYFEITGRLGVIDSDLKYISLLSTTNEWDVIGVHCTIKNSATKEMVKTLSRNQTIVVRGKITDVGEVLGYYLDIDEIIPQ